MNFQMLSFTSIFLVLCITLSANGHGMVLDPINRASRWRIDPNAPINYDDNSLFCGGQSVQWDLNDGKCGFCGDNYHDPVPRTNELHGVFGQGTIVKSYAPGSIMQAQVLVTSNHRGYFVFKLCNLDRYNNEESEECFDDITLSQTNGNVKFEIGEEVGLYNITLQIPNELKCNHCVLQWTWNTGNSWGVCEDGTGAIGCGEQENFRTCSDISIV